MLPADEIASATTTASERAERAIFTYRDERRLFALIGIIIVAALVALVQIGAQRAGTVSPIATFAGSLLIGCRKRRLGGNRQAARAFGAERRRASAVSSARTRGCARRTGSSSRRTRACTNSPPRMPRRRAIAPVVAALPRHRSARHRISAGERIARGHDRSRDPAPAFGATTA